MSIVLNVVTPTTSWIMSDGLAVDKETGKTICGSLRKFEMLHPRLCVGFTGVYEVASELLRNLRQLCPDINSATVDKAVLYSAAILKEFPEDAAKSSQFLFSGISDNGKLASITLKGDFSVQMLIPTKENFRFAVLYGSECSDLSGNIISFAQRGFPLNQAVKRGMTQTINQVAMKDPTVNRTTFFQEIVL